VNVIDAFSLKGRVAVVTGGAGLFGRQIVEGLAEAGARVIMASRDVAAQEAHAAPLRQRGLAIDVLKLDQSDERSIDDLLRQSLDRAGQVDVLVNNAVMRPMKGWSDDAAAFAKSMAVNATGVFLMTRCFGQHMAGRGRGSIINVGSIQGMVGPDFWLYDGLGLDTPPDYFFHKGGMLQLTRYAASKLGPRGVRVNCISPGGFLSGQSDEFVKRYSARTFLGRMANESDLKGVVVFLASDASAYITGANVPIDGGYTAK
jgi:NAD(P)-dependent dehydrogenase (short-subunit alcohol dehydrogenase family)